MEKNIPGLKRQYNIQRRAAAPGVKYYLLKWAGLWHILCLPALPERASASPTPPENKADQNRREREVYVCRSNIRGVARGGTPLEEVKQNAEHDTI